MKTCSKCKLSLPREKFNKNRSRGDGLQQYCRLCFSAVEKGRASTLNISEKRCSMCGVVKPRSDFNKNKHKRFGIQDRCRGCQRKTGRESAKKCRAENPELSRAKCKRYYWSHREAGIEKNKRWKRNNPTYESDKRKSDIEYRLRCHLRSRLHHSLKKNQGKKVGSVIRDLGCSISVFKQYIEALFREGMSWENYGEWHLDHILPLCSFTLSNREEFLKAFHYTNYQPLWAEENLSKGGKY